MFPCSVKVNMSHIDPPMLCFKFSCQHLLVLNIYLVSYHTCEKVYVECNNKEDDKNSALQPSDLYSFVNINLYKMKCREGRVVGPPFMG